MTQGLNVGDVARLDFGDGDKLRELAAGRHWRHTPPNRDTCQMCALREVGRFVVQPGHPAYARPNPVARSIVAMLLRQMRADWRNVQRARNLQNPTWIAQTTSVWCTSSGSAEAARRMLYGTDL